MQALKLLCIVTLLFLSGASQAQVIVSAGAPPMWGPVGYPEARYYYLPGVEAYYDVHSAMFIYYSNKAWVHKPNLPSRYWHYDLYTGYKLVMVDYDGDTPYKFYKQHKKNYSRSYLGVTQKTIGNKSGNGNKSQKSQGSPGKGNLKNKSNQSKR